MALFISVGIMILAAVAQSCLQLDSGCLMILYHESLKKRSLKKTNELAGSLIAGVGIMTLMLFMIIYIIMQAFLSPGGFSKATLLVLVAILLGMTIVLWLVYYRRGKGTELWISRSLAKRFLVYAGRAKNNNEAFFLGLLACLYELPFIVLPVILLVNELGNINVGYHALIIALYLLIILIPLMVILFNFARGKGFCAIQRIRVRNKTFLKTVMSGSCLVLILFIFAFKILGM